MGNNHQKYFGKEKRKVLVLGLPESGKTSLVELLVLGKQANLKVQKTKDLNIRDAKLENLSVTFFDIAGGERQRIFWKQHFDGTQGIIFLIDSSASPEKQLDKLAQNQTIKGIPFAVCLHKSDLAVQSNLSSLQGKVSGRLAGKTNGKIFTTSLKNQQKIKEMITWLLKETKPL